MSFFLVPSAVACSSSSQTDPQPGLASGGNTSGIGGHSTTGGASSTNPEGLGGATGGVTSDTSSMISGTGIGGTSSTGGFNSTLVGGTTASSSTLATGGATISMGGANQGGTSASTAVGGVAATGGSQSTAGTSTGTSAASGGVAAIGGSQSTGGTSIGTSAAFGGVAATGGSQSTGGTSPGGSNPIGSGGATGAAGSKTTGGVTSTGGVAGAAGSSAKVATCPVPTGAEMPEASVPAGYCAWVFAEGLTSPRGMVADAQGQLVVIEAGSAGAVTLLWDDNGDLVNSSTERMRIATVSGLNHGVAIQGGYLYASTPTTVYRWPYNGSHAALANRETVLSGMPSGGNHVTRTLVFDGNGNLYVNIGSASNIDSDSTRARVVQLNAAKVSAGAASYATDVIVQADGTRNEVGLRVDSRGRLWGVENGLDDLNRSDLGGDIHSDNPAEELNLFDQPGAFYGYPHCWSEGNLPTTVGLGNGTQWATPDSMNDGIHTDAWCRSITNVQPPRLTMQAHSAPLDLMFYQGNAFPSDMVGSAIITFHGSWNRSTATGYKVVVAPFTTDGQPTGTVTPLLESVASGDTGGGWTHRPVALATGNSGEVYVTSDADGLVMAIGHE